MAKDWKQHEVFDGTYCLDDLLDWHEMTTARNENELRAREAGKRGAE
jgi:hypothetical protein